MSEEDLNSVVEFTNRILELSGLNLRASLETREAEARIQVRGDDVSMLLGHNAELLDTLEYLGNRLHTKQTGEESRIVFDSGNYRARREKELQLMAEKAAERVRSSRVPFIFDAMNPHERRIIHLTLAQDSTVRTESQGSGENRKVTVYPA
ncbi:MAG TPA: R3H domain-containing nucleic acid-binding protein [Blastocatellia bacterium]|jgi:spoIIIJ-associated protein